MKLKKYSIILADPPWDYGRKQYHKMGSSTGAHSHYNVMSVKEMKEMDVRKLANKDCLLFMWTTGPFLDQSIDLMKHWGFDYKQVAFVWDKMKVNPGAYTTTAAEFVLVGKRKKGKIPLPRGSRKERQMVEIMRTKHSEKPDEVVKRIEAMFPTQSKIELFARSTRPGWDCVGDEINGKVEDFLEDK